MKKTKLVILNPTMPPRAIKLFNKINESKEVDLFVYFTRMATKHRPWSPNLRDVEFQHRPLKSFSVLPFKIPERDFFPFSLNPSLLFWLIKDKPQVIIIPGWSDLSSFFCFFYAKIFGIKIILRSESTGYEKSRVRTIFLPLTRFIVRSSDACIAIGSRSRDYLIKLGASKEKIFIAFSTTDIGFFRRKSKITPAQREKLKKDLGLGKTFTIMFNGQLIKRKGVKYILQAFIKLRKKRKDVSLLIVGYGPEEDELKELVKRNKIHDVVLTGFVENEELPLYYVLSDVFVLPSYEETWGLVIVEAMACGLPIITTDRVGASADLVKEGVNGFIVKAKNSTSLYRALSRTLKNQKKLEGMKKASLRIVAPVNLDESARHFQEAVEFVRKKG